MPAVGDVAILPIAQPSSQRRERHMRLMAQSAPLPADAVLPAYARALCTVGGAATRNTHGTAIDQSEQGCDAVDEGNESGVYIMSAAPRGVSGQDGAAMLRASEQGSAAADIFAAVSLLDADSQEFTPAYTPPRPHPPRRPSTGTASCASPPSPTGVAQRGRGSGRVRAGRKDEGGAPPTGSRRGGRMRELAAGTPHIYMYI